MLLLQQKGAKKHPERLITPADAIFLKYLLTLT